MKCGQTLVTEELTYVPATVAVAVVVDGFIVGKF